ncbi:hypothetical protein NQ317_017067 [Molorchus minor]|uniref:Odorant receptor n=1 Tax=Molorchus minor TaxID=1323400 RepID=A0ABQ9K4B6_9CUCU|nr:hypothetical protein NQ317_017067 [Molorchus minor]
MSRGELNREDFFYGNKVISRLCGIWLKRDGSLLQQTLCWLYIFLFFGTAACFFICELIILGETFNEIQKFISHIGLLLTHVVGILKCLVLVCQRNRIQNIMGKLQDENYRYSSVDTFQPSLLLKRGKRISIVFSILIFILYTFVGVSAHISSQITINSVVKSGHHQNATCYNFMPYYFFIPFTSNTESQCGYALFFMDISMDIFAWIIACHDGIFAGLLNCLMIQFLIVGRALRTIRKRCLKQLDMHEEYCILHDEFKPELEKNMYGELNRCIKHLNILLQVRNDIENSFTYVTLAQTIATLFVLASCLYVSSSVSIL